MRIAVIDALEIHPSERIHRLGLAGRHVASVPGPVRPPWRTLLRDVAVAMVTSAACWIVVG